MIGSGKEKGGTSASGAQSWRELAGPRRRRINSPQARKRRHMHLLKIGLGFLILILLIAGATWGVTAWKARETSPSIKTPSRPIERIQFQTNGVLPDGWLGRAIDLRPGTPMMEVDIHQLKEQLEAQGQVASASVQRVFPSDLRIVVRERIPAMRLAVAGADGQRRVRLVARDGTIYDGVGYPKGAIQSLPFVQPHRRPDGAMFPLHGIERVSELLEHAKRKAPGIYRTWRVISLEHYSGDLELPGELIEIRSTLVPRVIFSASGDFGRQMDRLEYILRYVESRGGQSIERIDLSLRGAAAVQFTSGRISAY